MLKSSLVAALARSFLAGEFSFEEVLTRGCHTLGQPWPWLRAVAQRYVRAFSGRVRARQRDVVEFLLHDRGFQRAWSKHQNELSVAHRLTEPQQMQPVAAAELWNVPVIESPGALAEWLGLESGELRWFADLKELGYKENRPRVRHYHYRILTKFYGNIRLIEAPKPRLKEIQKQILSEILQRVPPHDAAHGFVKGRSIKTFVAPHVGKRVILRMDLQDFFRRFALRGFGGCFARWDIRNQSPIFWLAFALMPRLALCGPSRRLMSRRSVCGKRESFTPGRICLRVRLLRLRSLTFAHTESIAA